MSTISQKFLVLAVGDGIRASRFPRLHEREADAQGVRLTYSLYDFAALGRPEQDLAQLLRRALEAGFSGLSVARPLEQAIVPLLDALAPAAAAIGAVNTVKFEAGRPIGHNTAAVGFAESMQRTLPDATLGRVVQFGAGASGAACAHALLEMGVEDLRIADPAAERLEHIVSALQAVHGKGRVCATRDPETDLRAADGVVNATPIGVSSCPGTPFDPGLLEARQWVSDIVYCLNETELVRQARARGCTAWNGGGMAVFQAAESFRILTGLQADRERMLAGFGDCLEPHRRMAA